MNSLYRLNEVSMTRDLREDLREITALWAPDKIFLILESNTLHHCWPLADGFRSIPEKNIIILKPGEEHKNLAQVAEAWDRLGSSGADRSSLIINIGGGMLTDLGGFIASTFKRGVTFINVPTTLLAMVDASTGGKTGINFRGLKNEIGVIRQPLHVFLYLPFLQTLDRENILSGYAEMLKAGLIRDASLWEALKTYDFDKPAGDELGRLIWRSVEIKKEIVDLDPEERGIRKSLNFGHTIGHALESESLHAGAPLAHGFAVAFGMVAEARLSILKTGLSMDTVQEIADTVTRLYGPSPALLDKIDTLIEWMRFDKKNNDNRINFTLLEVIGRCVINQTAEPVEISAAMRGI